MDHVVDVERLFSWIKAPMVHYREFAPQVEVADAVATWPLVHRAAVQSGVAAAEEAGPRGDTVARQRLARERLTMPAAAASRESTPAAAPSGDQLVAALGQRLQAEHGETVAEPEQAPVAPRRPAAPAAMTGVDEPLSAASQLRSAPERPQLPAHPPAGERGALFGGEYRGREREARAGAPAADRQDRSLDAVFSRLSGARDRLPDPRQRARTSPGLGSVFGRLR